jgi:hypothetical protein
VPPPDPVAGCGRLYFDEAQRAFRQWDEGNGLWVPVDGSNRVAGDWFINATTGDDDAAGTSSATALRTFAEWTRRVGTKTVPGLPILNIETSLAEDSYEFDLDLEVGLTVRGANTVIYSGTVSASQEWDSATSTQGEIEDSGLPVSWTASGLVLKKIVVTSGAATGAVAWVCADLGAKTARVTPFVEPAWWMRVAGPGVGDTFDIVESVTLEGRTYFNHTGNWGLWCEHLRFVGLPGGTDRTLSTRAARVAFYGCNFAQQAGSHYWIKNGGEFFGAAACLIDNGGVTFQIYSGDVRFEMCLLAVPVQTWLPGVSVQFWDSVIQRTAVGGSGIYMRGGGHVEVADTRFLAVYDQVATQACIALRNGATAAIRGKVFGTGNGGYGLWVDSGACATWPTGETLASHFAAGGAQAECRYGGTNITIAAIDAAGPGVINAQNNAMVVPAEYTVT